MLLKLKFVFLVCMLELKYGVLSARILIHIPTPTYSHNIVYEPLIKELVKRGHHVVSITTFPIKPDKDLKNLTQIDVQSTRKFWKDNMDGANKFSSYLESARYIYKVMRDVADIQLGNHEVRRLIKDDSEKFDLIIVEHILYHSIYGWGHRFKAPMVGISSLDAYFDLQDFAGNIMHPYMTQSITMDFLSGVDMSFKDRMRSVVVALLYRYDLYFWLHNEHDIVAKRHFGKETPSVVDLAKTINLMLVNENQALAPRANVPGMIYMDMMHIRPPQELPHKLRNFLDKSEKGVVYFSMGSNIKSSSLPQKIVDTLMKTFSKLPYNVLWKWELEDLKGVPDNVMLCQWCPQQDILAHKNVHLFMTQGGRQSMEESIHYRVPMICFPVIVDQRYHAALLKSKGVAESFDLHKLDDEILASTIEKMITDSEYTTRMDHLATLMEDQKESSLERVVWWIEYALRHNGAPHLKVPLLPWYKFFMLDAVAVALGIILCVIYVAFILLRFFWQMLTRENKIKIKTS